MCPHGAIVTAPSWWCIVVFSHYVTISTRYSERAHHYGDVVAVLWHVFTSAPLL